MEWVGKVVEFIVNTAWPMIWEFLDSNFSAALFGAGLGAWGAHYIAESAARRKQVIEEIRGANASNILAFTIFSICASLKEQHVRKLKQTFDQRRNQVLEHVEARRTGQVAKDAVLQIDTDFEHLTAPAVPIDPVKQLVFEKLSITRRPIILVAMLTQTLDALTSAIQMRNSVIEECKSGQVAKELIVQTCYGLPLPGGGLDARYSTSVDGIAQYTDDCIFFAQLLSQDLEQYAKELAATLGKKAPAVDAIDFSKARDKGLIPDAKLYKDWVDMWKPAAKPPQKRTGR